MENELSHHKEQVEQLEKLKELKELLIEKGIEIDYRSGSLNMVVQCEYLNIHIELFIKH